MVTLLAGVAVFFITGGAFWALLPRGGKTHRFVGTELEPYIGVGICAGVALAFTMVLSGTLSFLGNP
jgi:hypothetical protein